MSDLKKSLIGCCLVVFSIFVAAPLMAYGPHEALDCLGCHSPHYAVGTKIFAVENMKMKNPRTGESLEGMIAKKCLGCHELEQFGGAGIRPIHLHTTHPIGIKPNKKIADVPEILLNEGKLDCISCHEPHPSNPNFMYLRVNTGAEGDKIGNFCAMCHSAKVDLKAAGITNVNAMPIFSAMDQEAGAKEFSRENVIIRNPTPDYIVPLGPIPPNDILPNYQNPPDWVMDPKIDPTTIAPPKQTNQQPAKPAVQPATTRPATTAPARRPTTRTQRRPGTRPTQR